MHATNGSAICTMSESSVHHTRHVLASVAVSATGEVSFSVYQIVAGRSRIGAGRRIRS